MRKISVNVSRPYEVLIGNGLLDDLAALIRPVCESGRVAVVTDDIVASLYLKRLEDRLVSGGFDVFSFRFPNGEASKNLATLSGILEFLAQKQLRRNDTLIALGGGIVGDMAGLAAALYMRGISVIQVPTTLLSAVDSSVGGKTAVDLANGKNLVGAFWQPSMVVCDVDIISRLPDDVFAVGMAEAIKCSVIKELPVIRWVEDGTVKEHLSDVIYDCIALKRDIVEQDEFDVKGIRNVLNVGHTVAHAIEKLSGYTVSHGVAVGTGMVVEAQMAEKLGLCAAASVERIRRTVDRCSLLIALPWPAERLAEAMRSDKKNRDASIVFELPQRLGATQAVKLEQAEVVRLLTDILGA